MSSFGYSATNQDISLLSQQTPPSSYINCNSQKIQALALCTNSTDAANKAYVDSQISGTSNAAAQLCGAIIQSTLSTLASSNSRFLLCNGSTFNATTYPNLNTLLGGNQLPSISPINFEKYLQLFNGTSAGSIIQTGAYSNAMSGSVTFTQLVAQYTFLNIQGVVNGFQFGATFSVSQLVANQILQIAVNNSNMVGSVQIAFQGSSSGNFGVVTQSGQTISQLQLSASYEYSPTLYTYIIAS